MCLENIEKVQKSSCNLTIQVETNNNSLVFSFYN